MALKSVSHFLFALVLILSSWSAFAITDEEIFRNFQFSSINPGARSGAMGGAFIGLADDATAAEANPAGLTILTKPEVSFEYRHTEFDADRLNSFNFITEEGVDISIGSFNTVDDRNRPSYLSVVFPSGRSTYAFSRQEVVSSVAGIDEVFIVNIPGLSFTFGARGSQDQEIVNYNFSYATKLSDSFSIGATARYSTIDWVANVDNRLEGGVPLFSTSLDDTDKAFAWNAGALYQFGVHGAVGFVYKRNPRFELDALETDPNPLFVNKPGPYTNVLKVPDTLGFGLSIKPNDKMTIVSDIVRVMHSDLTEDIEVGRNVITNNITSADLTYKIDDAWEFHVGTEFVVFIGHVPVALRQGYYFRPSASLVVDTSPGLSQAGRNLLDAVFFKQPDEHHFTLGNGFVFGPHFQIDWALDLANISDSFIVSSVVRF